MMMRKLPVLFLLILSCSTGKKYNQSTATIDIESSDYEENIMLSDIFESLEVVSLKYASNSRLGYIRSVKGINDLIFVHDGSQEKIVIFDKKGFFKAEIKGQGPGPQEYGKINYFDINEDRETVEIYDIRQGEITAFNFDGQYKGKVDIRIICRDFAVTKNGNYLFYVPDEMIDLNGQLLQPGIVLVNRNGKVLHYQELGNMGYHPIISGNSIIKFKSKLYLFSNYVDEVYEIDDKGIRPYLRINYSNKINDDAYFNSSYNFEDESAPFLKSKIFKTEDYLGYSFIQRNQGKNLIINTKSNVFSIGKNYKNDIDDDLFFFFNGGQIGDNLYASKIDYDMIESFKYYMKNDEINTASNRSLVSSIDSIMENNNYDPILIVGSFKSSGVQ